FCALLPHLHRSFSDHLSLFFFFVNDTATTQIYTLSLHDALPILGVALISLTGIAINSVNDSQEEALSSLLSSQESLKESIITPRSEEHTSELQSRFDLVCRLLLEKKKKKKIKLEHKYKEDIAK